MTTETWWLLSLGIGAAIVAVVAALLGLVIAAARDIDRHAQDIWIVGKEIAGNTVSIWMLQRTNELLGEARSSIERLEETLVSVGERLNAVGRRPVERP